MDKEVIIEIKGVTKKFPTGGRDFTALKDINLKIQKQDFMGLVGPSGSGKTTLLNLIGALDVPTEGSITVLNNNTANLSHFEAANLRKTTIGFIFQSYNLLPVYTVFENVEFPLLILKKTPSYRKQAVNEALKWVGLSDKANSRFSQLSGGESQRVAVARAIVKKPQIVIADEPTANLDAKNSHNILKTMVELNKNLGITFVFSTHDQKVIDYLRRKVTLIDGMISKDEALEPTRNGE